MSLHEFDVFTKLGEGAYSTVFKARRRSDGQFYALKKVKFTPLKEKEKENALNEVRILASVHNPNVVGYKEAFIDKATDTLCIVMEFADSGDLLQRIQEHKKNRTAFREEDIWSILIQATKGLKALHDLSILHRDLKSANIFLTQEGIAKLGDMNVSKVAKMGLVYTQTGTPYYASPEVWKDQPYNSKSDVWGLGCVIYEVAALEPPFKASDMQGLFRKVIKGEYPAIPRHYSTELAGIIKSLLTVSSAHRPSCDMILNMHDVHKRNRFCAEDAGNDLLKTIYVPNKFNLLADKLPAAMYDRNKSVSPSLREVNASFSKRNTSEASRIDPYQNRNKSEKVLANIVRPPAREFRDEGPLRPYNEKKGNAQGTLAARIRILKDQYQRAPGVPPRHPCYNKPVVRPSWWG